jgi:predicted homoserine dehydrogenase-like protein
MTGALLCALEQIDIIVECTGNPIAAVEHCLAAFAHGEACGECDGRS